MPYYVHPKDTEVDPAVHPPFDTRQAAHQHAEGSTITFLISEDERTNWMRREYQRFRDGVYSLPPWIDNLYRCWEPSDGPDAAYGDYLPVAKHFAHTSLKSPGCVAYTPSDEHGYQDRQVTIKVGRYLEQFGTWLTQVQKDAYVESVKSLTAGLQIARSTSEIVKVYRNGPSSCMSHAASDYQTNGHHPCEVYGESDLGVAYLGSIGHPSARALVWPDRKLYSRVYGDGTLKQVLENDGYTRDTDNGEYGMFNGATVRAIKLARDRYVMPYLDCASGIFLSRDGKTFTLHSENDGDSWTVDSTDGFTTPCNQHYCAHCNEPCDEDETYCSSCEDERVTCDRCDANVFDGAYESLGGYTYCDSCIEAHFTHECSGCERAWTERNPDSEYCEQCRDHYSSCDECSEMFDTRTCDDPKCQRCDDCHEDETTEDTDTDTPVLLDNHQHFPTIANDITVFVGASDEGRTVTPLAVWGALAIHTPVDYGSGFVITHIPSGLVVTRRETYLQAENLARLLSASGINWAFRSRDALPVATRDIATYVIRHGELPESYGGESCPAF